MGSLRGQDRGQRCRLPEQLESEARRGPGQRELSEKELQKSARSSPGGWLHRAGRESAGVGELTGS